MRPRTTGKVLFARARAVCGSTGNADGRSEDQKRMLVALVSATAAAAPSPDERSGAAYMDCGTAPLCGVLVLETGLGSGNYKHDKPAVHGLWPETGHYGSSKCLGPTGSAGDPDRIYPCYDQDGVSKSHLLQFEGHEWGKHGRCAGVQNADDFFTQLCTLAEAPLELMAAARKEGHVDLDGYAQKLKDKGFPVFSQDEHNMQVEIAACAGSDGQWQLAAPADFSSKCGAATTDCHALTDKAACDKANCSWCLAGAVPPSCKSISEAKSLPPSVFECDNI